MVPVSVAREAYRSTYKMPEPAPREFLHDVLLYLNREDPQQMPTLDETYITVETTKKAEHMLVQNYFKALIASIPGNHPVVKKKLMEKQEFKAILDCINLLQIKQLLIKFRNETSLLLKFLEKKELKVIKKKIIKVAKPKCFDVLIRLAQPPLNSYGYCTNERWHETGIRLLQINDPGTLIEMVHNSSLDPRHLDIFVNHLLLVNDLENAYQIILHFPDHPKKNEHYITLLKAYFTRGEINKVLEKAKQPSSPFSHMHEKIMRDLLHYQYVQEAKDLLPFVDEKTREWASKKLVCHTESIQGLQKSTKVTNVGNNKDFLLHLLKETPLPKVTIRNLLARERHKESMIPLLWALPYTFRDFFSSQLVGDMLQEEEYDRAFSFTFKIQDDNQRRLSREQIVSSLIEIKQKEKALAFANGLSDVKEKNRLLATIVFKLADINEIELAEEILKTIVTDESSEIIHLSNAYVSIAFNYVMRRDDPDKSLEFIKTALLNDASYRSAISTVFDCYIRKQLYEKAFHLATSSLDKLTRNEFFIQLFKSYSYRHVDNFERALECLLSISNKEVEQDRLKYWMNELLIQKHYAEAKVVLQHIDQPTAAMKRINGEIVQKEKL